MEFSEIVKKRRSIRSYNGEPVKDEDLKKIIEAAVYAPSGGNNQTSHFLVFTNRDKISELSRLVSDEFSKMLPYEGMYKSKISSIKRAKSGNYDFTYGAPVLILIANRTDYSNAMADSVLCLDNMLLQATELGISSCYVNQVNWLREDPSVLQFLYECGLKENERVFCSGVFGYSDAKELPPLERKGNISTFID